MKKIALITGVTGQDGVYLSEFLLKKSLIYNTDKIDGTLRKLTDVTKLHQLGWKHKIELENGIKQIYDW